MISLKESFRKSGESLFALFKVILLSKHQRKIVYSNREKELVILGNGPSIKKLVAERRDYIEAKDLICVNYFPLTDLFEKLKPCYYVTSAPELWENILNERYLKKRDELLSALLEKTQWPLTVFIPFSARKNKLWELNKSNKNIQVVYYNDTGIEGFQSISFRLFKRNLAIPRPHNVIIPSIMLAINLGYKNIYLWGTENNQFLELSVDMDNNALINQRHYYDYTESTAKVMTKGGSGQRMVHEILHKFMLTFLGYQVIADYARMMKAKVWNQTPGSMIDAFERQDILKK